MVAPDAHGSRAAVIRPWLAGRSLRGRLIAGLLGLLALACATVGAVTYAHLHSVLISGLNSELRMANARFVDCLQDPPPGSRDGFADHPRGGQPPRSPGPGPCAQQQNANTLNAVFSPGATLLAANLANSDVCRLSPGDRALLTSLPLGKPTAGHLYGPRSVELSAYGDYQVIARSTKAGVVVTGMPLTAVTTTLRAVAVAEVAVFSVALLLTGIIGTMWVRVSLRPLRRVAATAARVTQLPLASGQVSLPERVPDADSRTEVGQVGAAFNRMLGHVESALARREASESRLRTFAADASHELRTPLAAIRGYAELARRHPGLLPDDVAHALSRVESESARMSELVDELLLLARLEAGRPLASEPVDLTRLVIDVTTDARVAAADHRWQLQLPEEPVVVRGDNKRLHQVLANLLSNAARHTQAGTVVTIALERAAPPPAPDGVGAVLMSVTDNGPGIAPELQPAVFERFVRGDRARSRAAGSSGLGLAIVHAITAAHGGTARVVSRPGETRFTIELPILDDAAPPAPGPAPGID
jgi:two-component system OmpR family sensor kinase